MHKFLGLSVCRVHLHQVRVSTIYLKYRLSYINLHVTILYSDFLIGLVTIPLQNTKMATSKAGEPMMTKTIQLTSAQMVETIF